MGCRRANGADGAGLFGLQHVADNERYRAGVRERPPPWPQKRAAPQAQILKRAVYSDFIYSRHARVMTVENFCSSFGGSAVSYALAGAAYQAHNHKSAQSSDYLSHKV